MIHIPMEWIDANIPNIDLLNDIYCRLKSGGTKDPDDDLPHPPIENYHPPLAPEDLERQWSQSQDSGFEE
ncbi:hypothetical protein PV326_013491 [Microctonus aethiopoides]|nr:hypothetical protein PV326_013491 [Microctonus aethiopoides]